MLDRVNRKKLKLRMCFGLLCGLGFGVSVHAQIFGPGIVGYINDVLYPGDNLIANQLSNSNNTLNAIFGPNVPEGTGFTKWDSAARQFLPISTYDTNSGWSINYTLTFGEGGLLHTTTTFTNTFVGGVWSGYDGISPFEPPLINSYGLLLLSCYIPIAPATFDDVVGRDPQNGESVTILNAATQQSTLTTFANGVWSNGDPVLALGQSAFYSLLPVPEPGTLGLLAAGAVLFAVFRRQR